tara:strand:- start:7401 stop:7895 length:495 start_codon:yes stop_codon:yes gene_type:complete
MSLHHKGYSHFRLSTLDDIKYLAPRLRKADKQEIISTNGYLPYYELLRGYKYSKIIFTIVNPKNEPVGIFGVDDLGNSVGGIWLVATDELATIQIAFLKQCREVVNFLNTKYKILWNYVDCRNKVHIKWLKWCGFTFINKTNYGVLNKPFYEFIKICVHHKQDY